MQYSGKCLPLVHARIVKCGLTSKTIVCNALIAAYSKCGSIETSKELFHGIGNNGDLVMWNSMFAAYVRNNRGIRAVELFIKMKRLGIKPDMYTCSTVISACLEQEQHKHGKALHRLVTKTGMEFAISVSNSLIAMYIKSGDKCMTEAIRCFNFMDVKDSVSWNTILTGFSQNELSTEALKLFALMRFRYVEINQYSLSSILRSCSYLSILQLGQQIHGLAFKLGLEQNDFVSSSLMFMYSKCGVIEDAEKSFTETNKDSSISWNSIIFGYAQHGQGNKALHLFSQMQESGVKPDHITFVGVMSACSHIGLVQECSRFLQSMEHSYGVPPRLEHYACAIDLLGRAGHLGEAKDLVDSMPMEPDAMVWKSLLGACRISGNVEIAAYAATYLEKLEPQEHSTYLILSDLYARFGRWNERAMVKRVILSACRGGDHTLASEPDKTVSAGVKFAATTKSVRCRENFYSTLYMNCCNFVM